MNQQRDEYEAVRHLIELGYVDPDVATAREAAVRGQLQAELQEATKTYEKGDVQQAAVLLERLSIDDPDWIAPHRLLAEIHYRVGRLHESQLELDWLAEHGVEHPRLALIAGAIALANRELAIALDALEYATHVDPDLPSVHTLLGNVLLRLGNLDRAEVSFQTAVEKNLADASALDGLAAVHLKRAAYEEAANFALEALEHDMRMFRAHYHLGIALAKLGRPLEAITALETATKLNATSAAPYYWLVRSAEQQLADPVRALQYRHKAREIIRERQGRTK